MRIVEESAKLISLSRGYGEFAHMNAAAIIEHCGRIAYQSQPKGDPQAFIDMLKGKKPTPHLAVLEFGWAAFDVTTDRGISHEAVRQRIASYVQESTRFCNYSKDKFGDEIAVVCSEENRPCAPVWTQMMEEQEIAAQQGLDRTRAATLRAGWEAHIRDTGCSACAAHMVWLDTNAACESGYLRLVKLGKLPQHARAVLPTDLKTQFAWAANFREWYQVVLPTRAHTTAHPQMVRLMQRYVFPQLAEAAPEVFGDWKTVLRGLGVEVP
jgi:thymidylate synthase (FAD)